MQPILVIDDDPQCRSVVRRALERAGYPVIEARNGEEGTRLAREALPSLVITDILMPDKEGLQVIRELHAAERSLPIVAMSGGSRHLAPDAVLRLARCFGAVDALLKPFGLEQLLAAVRSAVGPAGGAPPLEH
jgi:DNA-binding response OmpR family regulator